MHTKHADMIFFGSLNTFVVSIFLVLQFMYILIILAFGQISQPKFIEYLHLVYLLEAAA